MCVNVLDDCSHKLEVNACVLDDASTDLTLKCVPLTMKLVKSRCMSMPSRIADMDLK